MGTRLARVVGKGRQITAQGSSMASKKGKSLSQEEVIATFQRMRTEQQAIISKITELEGDKNEHRY